MTPLPPNNPLKLPFFLLCAAIGVFVAIVGVRYGAWWLTIIGVATVFIGVSRARLVQRGHNPPNIRSPLDTRWSRRRD
jgi:hypothetical protein